MKGVREIQLKELEIVEEIKRICDKYDIKWMLAYGSVLGAVRHEGFIPWDDDIDIYMDDLNYEKFVKACEADLDKEKFFLQTKESDKNVPFPWAKIRMNNTCAMEEKNKDIKMHWGICIDIFKLRYAPQKEKDRRRLEKIYSLYNAGHQGAFKKYSAAENIVQFGKIFIIKILHISCIRAIMKKMIDSCCKNVDRSIMWDDSECKFVSAKFFESASFRKFEGMELPCPQNPEEYCEVIYGEWKKLPPESERGGHAGVIFDLNKSYLEYCINE